MTPASTRWWSTSTGGRRVRPPKFTVPFGTGWPRDTRRSSGFPAGAYLASLATADVIEEPGNAALVRPLVRAAEGASSVSVTWVSIEGRHQELASRRSARLYYVLSGDLTFVLDGRGPTALGPSDLLVIPKGCPYYLEGNRDLSGVQHPGVRSRGRRIHR